MFWDALMLNGLIALQKITGNSTSDKYIGLLASYAVPLMKINTTHNFHFIQDNCPSHKSMKTMEFLKNENDNVLE